MYFGTPDEDDNEEIHDEFASVLSDYVIALKIPEAIPALLKATQFGNPEAYALADFGPQIVYDIIEYIEDSERTYKEIGGAFFALQKTVETHQPLNSSIRAAVKEITVRNLKIAEEYYNGPDGSIVAIMSTMSVARILGDLDLKQMIVDILPMVEKRSLQYTGIGLSFAQETLDQWDEVQQEPVDLND